MGFVRVYGFQNLSPLRRPRPPPGEAQLHFQMEGGQGQSPAASSRRPRAPPAPRRAGGHLREAPTTHPLRHWPYLLHVLSTGAGLGLGMEKKVRQSDLSPGNHQALEDRWAPDQVITFRKSVS